MKKFLTIFLLTLFTINFSSCEKNISEEQTEKKEFLPQVEISKIGENFSSEFSTLGEVFPQKESVSTSKISDGVVKNIYVKNGDKVKKGQVLMELKSDKTSQNYSNARNNYNKAVASGNQAVKSAEVNLANAKNIFEKQKAEFANSLSSSKISATLSVANAESNLNSTISLNEKTEKTSRENLENAINSAKILAENSLNEIDKILGIEDVNEENSIKYENYLGNLKSETLSIAKNNYRISKNFFDENNFSDEYEKNLEILKNVKKSADSNLVLLQNSTTGPNFTNTELQALISSTSNLVTSIQSQINSLISLKNSFDSTVESNKKSLASAQNALEIAKMSGENGTSQSVNLAESSYEKNLANLENSIKSAEEALNGAKASSQQNIASMLSGLKNAELSLADLRITADFSGEVSDVFVEVGDSISNGTKLVGVSNNAQFKIVTYLSKDQVNGISQGDEVLIGIKSIDKISSISGTSDSSTKKYKVEIIHENPFLSAGQFIDLKFSRKNFVGTNKIFLDLPTVFVTDSGNYVWVVENLEEKKGTIKKKKVELGGLSGNKVEIISGLVIGDKVVVKGGRFLKKDGDRVEIL